MNRRDLFKLFSFLGFGYIFTQNAEAKSPKLIKFAKDPLEWMTVCADYFKSIHRGTVIIVKDNKDLITGIKVDCKEYYEDHFKVTSENYVVQDEFSFQKAYLVSEKGYVIYILDNPRTVTKDDSLKFIFTLNINSKPIKEAEYWK